MNDRTYSRTVSRGRLTYMFWPVRGLLTQQDPCHGAHDTVPVGPRSLQVIPSANKEGVQAHLPVVVLQQCLPLLRRPFMAETPQAIDDESTQGIVVRVQIPTQQGDGGRAKPGEDRL